MTIELVELSNGVFFKPAEHLEDKALLIEPESIRKDVPNTTFDPNGKRDELTARLTTFRTQEELEEGAPSEDIPNAIFTAQFLVRDLEGLIGKATVVKVEQLPPAGKGRKGAFVFRRVDSATMQSVSQYVTKREAAVVEAAAAAPSFD